jgi:hypothetical protein
LDIRFTFLEGHHSNSLEGSTLFDTIGYPGHGGQGPEDKPYAGKARLREYFEYIAADVTLNRTNCSGCFDNFSYKIGLLFAIIRHKEKFLSVGSFIDTTVKPVNNHLKQHSRFWGLGPQLGLDYQYMLCERNQERLSLNASGRFALLCSNTQASFHYITANTGSVGVNLHNDSLWRVNPAVDARLSLIYNFCSCDSEITVEAGYELIWFHNCLDSIIGYDVGFAGDTIDLFSSLNMQGPFLAISKTF